MFSLVNVLLLFSEGHWRSRNQRFVFLLYFSFSERKLRTETKWKSLWMFGCMTIKWEAGGCLPGHHVSNVSLMKQVCTRLKSSDKFRIEFIAPPGQVSRWLPNVTDSWVLTPEAKESNGYQLTAEEKRPDCRHYREEMHRAIKIIVMGWTKCL